MINDDPVSVVICAFNEAETIAEEVQSIREVILSRLPGAELIVAEDGSTDGTHEMLREMVDRYGIVHSTSTQRKGYARALRDAFNLAKAPYVFFSDTGNKYDFEDFWKLYPHRGEYGLVVGVRTGRTDQGYRKVLTWGYNRAVSLYFGVPLADADSGFRLYRRDVVSKVFNEPWVNRHLIASEIHLRVYFSGFPIHEVPVLYRGREGESRGIPLRKLPETVFTVLSNFPRLKKELNRPGYAHRQKS